MSRLVTCSGYKTRQFSRSGYGRPVPPATPAPLTAEDLRLRMVKRIRALASDRRMSLAELARVSGVSRAALQAILAGRRSPTLDTIAKLANALRVDPIELLRGPPRAKKPKASEA